MHYVSRLRQYCRREENCHAHFIHPHRYPLQYPDSRHPSHGESASSAKWSRWNLSSQCSLQTSPPFPCRRPAFRCWRADSDSGGAVHGAAAVRSGLPQRARAKTSVRQAGHSDGKRAAFAGQHEKTRITPDELTEFARMEGITDLSGVKYAILETGGQISILPYTKYKPACAKDAGVKVEDAQLP